MDPRTNYSQRRHLRRALRGHANSDLCPRFSFRKIAASIADVLPWYWYIGDRGKRKSLPHRRKSGLQKLYPLPAPLRSALHHSLHETLADPRIVFERHLIAWANANPGA